MILYDANNNKYRADKCKKPYLSWRSSHHFFQTKKTIDYKIFSFWGFSRNFYFEYLGNWYRIPIDKEINSYFTEKGSTKERLLLRIKTIYGIDISNVDFNLTKVALDNLLTSLKLPKKENKFIQNYIAKPTQARAIKVIENIPELVFIFEECSSGGYFTKVKESANSNIVFDYLQRHSESFFEITLANISDENLIENLRDHFVSNHKAVEEFHADHDIVDINFSLEYSTDKSKNIILDIIIFVFPFINYNVLKYSKLNKSNENFFRKVFLFYLDQSCKSYGITDFMMTKPDEDIMSLYEKRIMMFKPFKAIKKNKIEKSGLTRTISWSLFKCFYQPQYDGSFNVVKEYEKIVAKIINKTVKEFIKKIQPI